MMGPLSLPYVILVLLTTMAAFIAVTERNLSHAVAGLTLAFAGAAGLFLLLDAPLVAAAQLAIGAGWVAALSLWLIQATGRRVSRPPRGGLRAWLVPATTAGSLFAVLVYVINVTPWKEGEPSAPPAGDPVARMADTLLQTYLFPVEVAGALLLAAVVAGLALTRPERVD